VVGYELHPVAGCLEIGGNAHGLKFRTAADEAREPDDYSWALTRCHAASRRFREALLMALRTHYAQRQCSDSRLCATPYRIAAEALGRIRDGKFCH
jgi:hypothetical protein